SQTFAARAAIADIDIGGTELSHQVALSHHISLIYALTTPTPQSAHHWLLFLHVVARGSERLANPRKRLQAEQGRYRHRRLSIANLLLELYHVAASKVAKQICTADNAGL
ncbi:MAG TPA: hypothetical protein VKV18_01000, partial [Chthonomonas sp.]|uniref:hypothetical protein n=1 Tax=Chthonomonas sp. TaxID=2282153 RepID=UPI002B4B71BD